MDRNHRRKHLGWLACRVIVIMAALLTCRTAQAQDSSVVDDILPVHTRSVVKSWTDQFNVLNVGRTALLSGNFPVGETRLDNAGGELPSAMPQTGRTQNDVARAARRLQ